MVALQAEDTVKEITSTIDNVYDALVKEFNLGVQGESDRNAIQMVRYVMECWNRHEVIDSFSLTTVAHDVVQL